MASVTFNAKDLTRILQDIYMVTGIRVSIFEPPIRVSLYNSTLNFHNFVAYPNDMPQCFCRSVRQSRYVDDLCLICDEKAVDIVTQTGKPYIYKCHFGFMEVLIPIIINGTVAAICFLGQIRSNNSEKSFDRICDKIKNIDQDFYESLNLEELREKYDSMKVMTTESVESLCRLIDSFVPVFVQSGLVSTMKSNIKSEFVYYVHKNINKHIKLSDATEALNISQAHLCRIVKQEFGMSFTEYINDVKIKKAKEFLSGTSYSVSEIAQGLGFDDSNYFSRLFKKITGETAINYRKMHKKVN